MTQVEIAKLAEIGDRTYRAWEYGEAVPNMGPGLRSVAAVLRVSPGYLLFGEEQDHA